MTAIEEPAGATARPEAVWRVGPVTLERRGARPVASWRDDLMTVAIGAIGVVAMYWDSWRHNNEFIESDGFWSPPHILLYLALAAAAFWVGLVVLRHQEPDWKALNLSAVPRGYGVAAVGLVLATVGGLGDYVWHAIFGFEDQVDAWWSPPHQLLFLGGTLIAVAPLVSSWYRDDGRLGGRAALPAIGSLILVMGTSTYALTHLSALWNNLTPTPAFQHDLLRFDDAYSPHSLGPGHASMDEAIRTLGDDVFPFYYYSLNQSVASFLFLAITLTAPVLVLVRRWRPPFGATAAIFGLYGLIASIPTEFRDIELVVGLVVAGLVIDALIAKLRPELPARPWQFRAVGATIPPLALGGYLLALEVLGAGLAWEISIWLGVMMTAGIIGFGLACLMALPRTGTT